MKYDQAVTAGLDIVQRQEALNWELGDLALSVEPKYGESTIQRLAEDIGVDYGRLLNCRTVAAAYQTSLRSEVCAWSVHQTLAAQPDRVELVKTKRTAADARKIVQGRKAAESTIIDLEEMASTFALGVKRALQEAPELPAGEYRIQVAALERAATAAAAGLEYFKSGHNSMDAELDRMLSGEE